MAEDNSFNKSADAATGSVERLITRLLSILGAGERGLRLAKGAAGTLFFRSYTLFAAFLIGVLLSRTLGAAGLGEYAYAIAWVQLLLVVAVLGYDRLLVREIAAKCTTGEWSSLRGQLRRSQLAVLVVSVILAVLGAVAAWLGSTAFEAVDRTMVRVIWIGLPLLPLLALLRVRQAILHGLQKVALSQSGEMFAVPTLFILLTASVFWLVPEVRSSGTALRLQITAVALSLIYMWLVSRHHLPPQIRQVKPSYPTGIWRRSGLPMLAVAGIQVVNARVGILMVGAMMGSEAAGIYSVAQNGAMLTFLIFYAVNIALVPAFAALHAQKNTQAMQRLISRAAMVTFAVSFPIGAVLVIFSKPFLSIFGSDFIVGSSPLIIMTIGQLIIIAHGSVSAILLMTGFERSASWAVGGGAAANVLLNLLLIPKLGLVGAAYALSAGQIGTAATLTFLTWRKLGIVTLKWFPSK